MAKYENNDYHCACAPGLHGKNCEEKGIFKFLKRRNFCSVACYGNFPSYDFCVAERVELGKGTVSTLCRLAPRETASFVSSRLSMFPEAKCFVISPNSRMEESKTVHLENLAECFILANKNNNEECSKERVFHTN